MESVHIKKRILKNSCLKKIFMISQLDQQHMWSGCNHVLPKSRHGCTQCQVVLQALHALPQGGSQWDRPDKVDKMWRHGGSSTECTADREGGNSDG